MKRIFFLLLLITTIHLSCRKTNQNELPTDVSIEGIWSYVENDTIYGEVIFTKDHFWEYTEHGGETYLPYVFRNDTIQFINWNGDPYITTKFSGINPNEFTLIRDNISVHYNRLAVPVDTAGLLRGDDQVLHEYVFKGLMVRKYDWESSRK